MYKHLIFDFWKAEKAYLCSSKFWNWDSFKLSLLGGCKKLIVLSFLIGYKLKESSSLRLFPWIKRRTAIYSYFYGTIVQAL